MQMGDETKLCLLIHHEGGEKVAERVDVGHER